MGLNRKYRRVTKVFFQTIFPALDECEKAGDACPFPLQCQEQENATFACACDAGLKVVGEGDNRTCEGMVFTIFSTSIFQRACNHKLKFNQSY